MDLDLWVTVGAVLWGAAAGVLVPRVAYRLSVEPEQPWRDRCPDGHPIGGWVGPARCADGRPYGPGTALVCGATALVCAVLALATGTRPELLVWLLIAPVGVLLTIVDFRVQRLPDVLTLPLAGLAPLLLGAAAALPEHAGRWPSALLGALVLGVAYFLLFLVNPNGMGFGDVKLAPGLGAVLGWYGLPTVVLGTFAGFLFGGLYGLGLVLARRAGRRTAIPFGPFLIAGTFVGLLIGAYAA
ncbi:prepilin peptidase [Streptomyces sp. NPDC004096]|uniref:prepilin peptidase n=1 Tax=unclassified Streptomyces TaxID=2593676 RepID=UPI0033B5827E